MKKLLALLILIVITVLVFYKPPSINLEGEWAAKEIVVNGKDIYTDSRFAKVTDWIDSKPVIISNWTDSIYIQTYKKNMMSALLEIKYDKEKPYVILSSKEEFLNGKFDLSIDTIPNKYINHSDFTVEAKMKSNYTSIHLQRVVFPKPAKKVDFPVKGRP